MIDLRLEYQGGGQFRTANRASFDACHQIEPGERLRARLTRKRSVQQNELFHAAIELAFANQRGGPMLPSWKHLKGWLLIQVGHCDTYTFEPRAMTPQVAALLRKLFDHVDFTVNKRGEITMRVARSVSFASTDREEMGRVVDEVLALICAEIMPGTTPETLFQEARRAA